jgi:hypothetical protein
VYEHSKLETINFFSFSINKGEINKMEQNNEIEMTPTEQPKEQTELPTFTELDPNATLTPEFVGNFLDKKVLLQQPQLVSILGIAQGRYRKLLKVLDQNKKEQYLDLSKTNLNLLIEKFGDTASKWIDKQIKLSGTTVTFERDNQIQEGISVVIDFI